MPDNEAELLRDRVAAIQESVLNGYPATTKPLLVGPRFRICRRHAQVGEIWRKREAGVRRYDLARDRAFIVAHAT
ncbi:hypothetical protein [Mycobacterium lacus]|uniref:Uncharacterized protein n=1 Tax=Mycobacterium lacus TaxID=169765 RepID=A0A1X1Y3V4_9MYCO|nr:hypothetical protein [Mycobacterium lacus]ORW05700.1 hypothetical protein AWC15_01655 [Mycobacterium lacus]BBX99024.1 hypothetical protein MLAC_43180 [Mycobacterium lacus]